MRKSYSREIAEAIRNFLDGDDWHYSFDEETGLFRFNLTLHGKLKSIDYVIDVQEDEFVCYAISPIGGDTDDREMMASLCEFFCRANYGLKNGNFEFDPDDGEIRYKSYVDCDGVLPGKSVVRNAIYCTASMFKRYSRGYLKIIFGDMGAEKAINLAEGRNSSDEEETDSQHMLDEDDAADMLRRLMSRLGQADKDTADSATSAGDNDTVGTVDSNEPNDKDDKAGEALGTAGGDELNMSLFDAGVA